MSAEERTAILEADTAALDALVAQWPTMPETARDALAAYTWDRLDREATRQRHVEAHLAKLRASRRLQIWKLLVMGVTPADIGRRLGTTRMAVIFTALRERETGARSN